MISMQKCQFLAISEDLTNVYACCSFKLIINNECLIYIHSSDLDLIIYLTKIRQFHVSQFWLGTGPSSPFVVLALWLNIVPVCLLKGFLKYELWPLKQTIWKHPCPHYCTVTSYHLRDTSKSVKISGLMWEHASLMTLFECRVLLTPQRS